MAAAMLVYQPTNQRRLHKQDCPGRQNLRTISLPQARIAKVDLGSGRQTCLADAPPLQFPPIKFGRRKSDRWYSDVGRLLAAKNADSRSGCLSTSVVHR